MKIARRTDLDAYRGEQRARIDQVAAEARAKHLTPGVPYAEKLREAEAGGGPILQAEAKARGVSVVDLAAEVIRRSVETATALGRIEACRVTAKQAVSSASSPSEAEDIANRAIAELQTL